MKSVWLLLVGALVAYHCLISPASATENAPAETDAAAPTFSQCKPYVDAALKGEDPADPTATTAAVEGDDEDSNESNEDDANAQPTETTEDEDSKESEVDNNSSEETEEAKKVEDDADDDDSKEGNEKDAADNDDDDDSKENKVADAGDAADDDDSEEETKNTQEADSEEKKADDNDTNEESDETPDKPDDDSKEDNDDNDSKEDENTKEEDDSNEDAKPEGTEKDSATDGESGEDSKEEAESHDTDRDNVANDANESDSDETKEEQEVQEVASEAKDAAATESAPAVETEDDDSKEDSKEEAKEDDNDSKEDTSNEEEPASEDSNEDESKEVSYILKSREHVEEILGLDDSAGVKELENLLDKATQTTLKDLKNVYETAIKPLETTYKYRDLSNRHFGDPEIFSKPMVVFMGPWSGGKSTIINWLLGIENQDAALRTGADPSPAQFNIMIHGGEDEVLDGTQLAADWTFSGLQKFGQAFLDRLRGRKLPNRLLEKVNLVEIPGILEVRKQVERSFPFNDACQWFIDRADVLFLVYDPAKLDIGPETEAILDQLKGRENQVRIVLNKADSVKPDELLRLQANLIWNISPLMASAEPPTLYVASLWGRRLNPDSPTSLLSAHENHFLKDIRDATEKRVETRIAAARRFAVRVRNHAKMCDCYLNTYNNHRSFFSNKKKISDDIIENPQNYHIYEGLSTLRNISRYDLPDPDTYKDFFRLNPLWEFPTLASTCTYFRGCPINKLDIAIAYDLPELLGKYRRQRESIMSAQTASGKK